MRKAEKIQLWSMFFVLALAVCLTAGPAFGAYNVKTVWQRFSAVAGETITRGNVVCLKAADGLVYKADANVETLRPAVGIAGNTASTGYSVEIVVAGILNGWSGLTIGGTGYVSETPAAITQSAPSYFQQVGFAISATEYLVNFRSYLDTSALTSLDILTGLTPLRFEGATVDANITAINIEDPTANRVIRLRNTSGDFLTASFAAHNYAGAAANWTMTQTEAASLYLTAVNSGNAVANAVLPSCTAGQLYILDNTAGNNVTLKVTGQTGGVVGNNAVGVFVCTGTDVQRVSNSAR